MLRIRRPTQRHQMLRIMDHLVIMPAVDTPPILATDTDRSKEVSIVIIRLMGDLHLITDTTMIDPTTIRRLTLTRSSRLIRPRTRMDTLLAVDRTTIPTRPMPVITAVTLVPTMNTSDTTTDTDTVNTIMASRRMKRVE